MFRVTRGADFGWPYCYYDRDLKRKVMAPEYGGDARAIGRCAAKDTNGAVFPGHWAPNALLFYDGRMFPPKYRGGAFIAFHGSWNRAPLPQAGFNVVFQPMTNGRARGQYEVFADGFVAPEFFGPNRPNQAQAASLRYHRPTGLAQGTDGALYVADDNRGRIWRIVYRGGTQ